MIETISPLMMAVRTSGEYNGPCDKLSRMAMGSKNGLACGVCGEALSPVCGLGRSLGRYGGGAGLGAGSMGWALAAFWIWKLSVGAVPRTVERVMLSGGSVDRSRVRQNTSYAP